MKQAYTAHLRLNRDNEKKLFVINEIIDEYADQGYRLTLRQLYYQLVSRDIIPNQQKEYAKLSDVLVKGRMAGVVDWNAIEDRIRVPYIPYSVDDIEDAMEDTIDQYRLDRQRDQDVYLELWVEKDALSGVLRPITSNYHIRLMVNRGYSSCTAMHDAAKRIIDSGKEAHILYLGDHDPSGMDMVRDISDRLAEFGAEVIVEHIGLTDAQVEKYNPPPNPAKFSDPRAKEYVRRYGRTSWEVDALNPKVLNALVKTNVERLIDMDAFNRMVDREEEDKERLRNFSENV